MKLLLYPGRYAACRLNPEDEVPPWAMGDLLSITRTPRELSILCAERSVPLELRTELRAEFGFRALELLGPLDFSAVGVLASLANPLAAAGISILAISTFDTDVILVRESDLDGAADALRAEGFEIIEELGTPLQP
jgi:uncharacterized protein